jgi:MoxR-like ATPase
MRPKQIASFLEKALDAPDKMPPLYVWGQPGVGKSRLAQQVAESMKVDYVDIRLSQRDPTDLRGIPAVIQEPCTCHEGRVTIDKKDYLCPKCNGTGVIDRARWLKPPELPTEGRGIIALDELSSAPPLVQVSAYQLCLDRKIGEYTVPKGYYIMAMGNRIEDRAVVYRMSTALANRFVHVDFDFNMDDWITWALARNISPNIIAFARFRPELICPKFDPNSSEKAFATPRTWEFADTLLKTTSKNVQAELMEGTIGKGATLEFQAFLKVQTELPDLAKIFAGDDFVPTRTDLRYAIVSALASRANGVKQFNRLIEYSYKLPQEFGVLLVQLLISKNESDVMLSPAFEPWARKNQDIIIIARRTTV